MSKSDNNKRTKPDDPSSSPLNEISNNELARMITKQNKTTQDQIYQLGNELRRELNLGLSEIKEEINDIRTTLSQVRLASMDNTETIARSHLANDLLISGVPYTKNEDLYQYFRSWCEVLGYTMHMIPMVDIHRLTKQLPRDGTKPFILVQFAITNQRNVFFHKYLRSRNLTLKHIGFQSDSRVFVNENLIPSARKIKAKAIELKKKGKLVNVFSRSGIIYIRTASDNEDRRINTEEELQEF